MENSCKNKHLIVILLFPFCITFGFSQNQVYEKIKIPGQFDHALRDSVSQSLIQHVDNLFYQIARGSIDSSYVQMQNAALTKAILTELRGIENEGDSLPNHYHKQLLRFYPIANNTYSISIGFLSNESGQAIPVLKTIFNLIATHEKNVVRFSLPLSYLTRNWKSTKIGKTTYVYKDTIQLKRAHIFNKKNHLISRKMNIPTESFKFYMCENYQEISRLLGYEYALETATTYRDGYGVQQGYIFSIMNNEDFSHDVFHYYSGKINDFKNRNWLAEEGTASSWGNAYYTDKNGEMIELEHLVFALKTYLKNNKEADLLHLFTENPKIFDHIAPELSIRSVIAGVLSNEIERSVGIKGIHRILNSRKTESVLDYDNYFRTLNTLIGINKSNFNRRLKDLLATY